MLGRPSSPPWHPRRDDRRGGQLGSCRGNGCLRSSLSGSTGHVLAQQQLILQPAFHALFNVQSQQQSPCSVSVATICFPCWSGSGHWASLDSPNVLQQLATESPACTVLRHRWRSPKTPRKDFKQCDSDQKRI